MTLPAPASPLRVVLYEPQIPPNTGNIARTCAAFQLPLALIEPLGFCIDDRSVRRAGLDYWPHVQLSTHPDLNHLLTQLTLPYRLIGCSRYGGDPLAFSFSPVMCCCSAMWPAKPGASLVIDPDNSGRRCRRRWCSSLNLSVACALVAAQLVTSFGVRRATAGDARKSWSFVTVPELHQRDALSPGDGLPSHHCERGCGLRCLEKRIVDHSHCRDAALASRDEEITTTDNRHSGSSPARTRCPALRLAGSATAELADQ